MPTSLTSLYVFFEGQYQVYYMGQNTTIYLYGNVPTGNFIASGDAATQPFDGMLQQDGVGLSATIVDGVMHAVADINIAAPPPDDPKAGGLARLHVNFNAQFNDALTVAHDVTVTFTPEFVGSNTGPPDASLEFTVGDQAQAGDFIYDPTGPQTVQLLAGHTYITSFRLALQASGIVREAEASTGAHADYTAGFFVTELDSDGNAVAGNPDLSFDSGFTHAALACFASGTRIGTDQGEVAVERLRVGDCAVTADGAARPIRWIGTMRVDAARHPRPNTVRPVRIRRDAFGAGLPHRDLYLSPDHAIFVEDVLIPVKCLINGTTVRQMPDVADVTYFHVELDHHDVLLAEGLPVESYLETGNAAVFAGGGTAIALYQDFTARIWDAEGYAPMVMTGPKLEAARRQLAAAAPARARRPTPTLAA